MEIAALVESPIVNGYLPPAKPKGLPPLNPRQELFVLEWFKDGNASRAAAAAGYAPQGARMRGYALLANPRVKAHIAAKRDKREKKFDVTAEKVLEQAARMAFVDPRAYVNAAGELIPLHQLSDEAAAALQGLEVDQGQNGKMRTRYKLVDRGAAVDKLMRHLGMFEKDNTQAVDAVGNLLASIHSAGSRIGIK